MGQYLGNVRESKTFWIRRRGFRIQVLDSEFVSGIWIPDFNH